MDDTIDVDGERQVFVSFPHIPLQLRDPPQISPWHLLSSDVLRILNSEHGIPVQDLRLTCQSWSSAFGIPPLKPVLLYEDANFALNVFSPFPLQSWVNEDYSFVWSKMEFKFLKVPHPDEVIGFKKKNIFVGCSYGYLVSVDEFGKVQLVNPFTRKIIDLPPYLGSISVHLGSMICKAILDSDPDNSSENYLVVLLCNPGLRIFVSQRNKWKMIESEFYYSDVSFTGDGSLCAIDSFGTSLHVWESGVLKLCFEFDYQFESMIVPRREITIEYPLYSFHHDLKDQFQYYSSSLVLSSESENKFVQVIQSVDSTSMEYSPIFHLYEYDIPSTGDRIQAVPVNCIGKMAIFLGLNEGKIIPSNQYGVEGNSIYFIAEWLGSKCPWIGIYCLDNHVSRLLPMPHGTIPSWLIPLRDTDSEDAESLKKAYKDEGGSDPPSKRRKTDPVQYHESPKTEIPEYAKDSSLSSEEKQGRGRCGENAASLKAVDTCVAGILGSTRNGEFEEDKLLNDLLTEKKKDTGLPLVKCINVSGWVIRRNQADLPDELIFHLNHLGSDQPTFTSKFSKGPSAGALLTWHIRLKIALEIARGFEYLHEHCKPSVIHILLDSNINAKLSDFGLAILDGSQKKNNMKLSGTLGYVAPEYLLDGKLTEKSDMYAFGVVLLNASHCDMGPQSILCQSSDDQEISPQY